MQCHLKGKKAILYLKEGLTSVFIKRSPVPYALHQDIQAELERLEKQGTVKAYKFSDWVMLSVPVVKPDYKVRICGDYKLTVNKFFKMDSYPIPKIDDVYVKLAGGKNRFRTGFDLHYHLEKKLIVILHLPMGLVQFCLMSLTMVMKDPLVLVLKISTSRTKLLAVG